MGKVNFKENRKKFAELNLILDSLAELSDSIERYTERVKKDYELLFNDLVDQQLKSMPIDELSSLKPGIRVNALKKVGYDNFYQLRALDYAGLLRIPGIGEASAHSICDGVRETVNTIVSSTHVVVNEGYNYKLTDNLVHSLFLLHFPHLYLL